ncbi:unnamed protein product [Rotaria sp. Silwood2]|nr:unnamed protein product [Rotaria sp. Silwood2]
MCSVLLGEWDCPDASDEQGLFLITELSLNNRFLNRDLKELKDKCYNRYIQQPFANICNITEEYPCLLANVSYTSSSSLLTQILNASRPCIKLNQIGDGHSQCYGSLDERNLLADCQFPQAQAGFNFRCKINNTLRSCSVFYSFLCDPIMRCLNTQDDAPLCFHRPTSTNSECDQDNSRDVICYNGDCKKNARCNGQIQCQYGEDEYWCDRVENLLNDNIYYRDKKRKLRITTDYLISLKKYPAAQSNRQHKSIIDTNPSISELPGLYDAYKNFSMVSYSCNRGIAVRYSTSIICFCPPSYYGQFCQYHSDRITVITHLDWAIPTNNFTVLATLLWKDLIVIDQHIFHKSHDKHRFYLLYKRSNEFLQHKQQRFLNRTQIIMEHPYSIRFEAYNATLGLIGVWHYIIYFDFLPAHRFSKILKLNREATKASCPSDQHCHPIHSTCHRYENVMDKSSYYCHCKNGFFGLFCDEYDDRNRCLHCSSTSICKPNYPLCLCLPNTHGPGCNIRLDDLCYQMNLCQNNGTCYLTFDSSIGERYQCRCTTMFYGEHCETAKANLEMQLTNSNSITAVATVQYYNIDRKIMNLNVEYQQLYEVKPYLSSQIRLSASSTHVPILAILKLYYNEEMRNEPLYFMLYVQPNTTTVNISTALTASNQCNGKKLFFIICELNPKQSARSV